MKVVALHSLKGGVGKSTAAVHLAHLSARAGRPTLLWDLDGQGAASWIFRVRVKEDAQPKRFFTDPEARWGAIRGSDWPDLDVLPADLSVVKLEDALRREEHPERVFAAALADLCRRYERIVLDCQPSLSPLTRCVFHVADALLVPTLPTALSLRTLATLHAHLKTHRRRGLLVLPFFSMVDLRRAMHRRVREFVRAEELGFLAAEIPCSVHVESAAAERVPLTSVPGHPLAPAFEALERELEQRLAAPDFARKLGRSRLEELVRAMQDGTVPTAPSQTKGA